MSNEQVPEYLEQSPMYSLYLILESMPEEEDDWDDPRMRNLYEIVEQAKLLMCSPEEIMDARKQEQTISVKEIK